MKTALFVADARETGSSDASARSEAMMALSIRVRGEFREMPGLRLTLRQAARLFGIPPDVADAVLHDLRRTSVLERSSDGVYSLMTDPSRSRTADLGAEDAVRERTNMNTQIATSTPTNGSLSDASLDRLACLLRHWTWADEAMATFDRELANGWDYDDDPMADHPFGAYYRWCALLCAFGEAAIDHGLLSLLQLEPIRQDLEASLPGLRSCRQLLVVIPASLEEHPRIVNLLRDGETLSRLRHVHQAFGEALRNEQVSREIDSLDQ